MNNCILRATPSRGAPIGRLLAAGVSLSVLFLAAPALAQANFCLTDECEAVQKQNQIDAVSVFGTLLDSEEGLAVLEQNAVVTTQIYATSTPEQRDLAAINAVGIPGVPQKGEISVHLWNMVDSPISAQMMEWASTDTMPGHVLDDIEGSIQTLHSGSTKNYYQTFEIYKEAYGATWAAVGNPRPFVALPAVGDNPWTSPTTSAEAIAIQQQEWAENTDESSFASGHSMRGFITGLYYGLMLPTYSQDVFASAQQYALSRNVIGMHYALDVIGGRIIALQTLTSLLSDDPNYSSDFSAAVEADRLALAEALGSDAMSPLYQACSANLSACLSSGVVPTAAEYRAARDLSTYYLTYGLPSMGDTTLAAVVPENAELLFRARYPYLSDEQIRAVIASTELASGVPLDDGSGWARINPYAAAGGYGAFDSTVYVDMDAAEGGLSAFDIWSNDISGSGGLTKLGTGTLLLAGDNTYAGSTTVVEGTLALTGSITSELTILTEAAFQSTGSVYGDVTNLGLIGGTGLIDGRLVNSGILAPGFSVGTMTVTGDLILDEIGALEIETSNTEANQSDSVEVGGTAYLDGELVVTGENGRVAKLGTYDIITAEGGIEGSFDEVTANGPFISVATNVSDDVLQLLVTANRAAIARAGFTPNANAVARSVATMPESSPVLGAVAGLTSATAQAGLSSLTGEIHAATGSVLMAQSAYLRQTLTDRMRALELGGGASLAPLGYAKAPAMPMPATGGFTAWGQGYGGWGNLSGNANVSSVTSSVGGFLGGFDGEVTSDWRLGVAGGYSQTSYSTDDVSGSGNSDNYDLALYGSNQFGAVVLRYAASYTWHDISTSRSVVLPDLLESLTGDQNGSTGQVFGELRYQIAAPGGVLLEPFIGLAYVRLDLDGFTESGGTAALTSGGTTQDNVLSTLGARVSYDFTAGTAKLAAHGSLAWQHAFGDVDPALTERFAFSGGSAFSVTGAPIARDTALVGLGLDWMLTENARLGVSYTGQLASDLQNNAFQGRLSVSF